MAGRCGSCGAHGDTVMTTGRGRRVCPRCADDLLGRVAALLSAPEQPAADLVVEAARAPGWADRVRVVRRRRSARG